MVELRAPRDADGPICRMLLPEAVAQPGPPVFLLAVEEGASRVYGAACWSCLPDLAFGVRLRVIRTERRRGIGSLLLRRVLSDAAARGCRRVVAPFDALSQPEAEPFLRRHGFERTEGLRVVEAELEPVRDSFAGLAQRLSKSSRVPANARIIPLSQAPGDQVARLHVEHISRNPDLDPEPVARALSNSASGESPVLAVGGRVVGMLLGEIKEAVAHVRSRVVAADFRGGWANSLLMCSALELAWNTGARRVRFEIPEGNRDTIKLADRFHARTVEMQERFFKELNVGG